jgi:sugar lactone lactonase YvrE
MNPAVDVALAAGAELGEGPRWDPRHDELLWVDCVRGQVHRFDPATGRDAALTVADRVGAVAWRVAGGYVVAAGAGFAVVDAAGAVGAIVAVGPEPPGAVMNDGACDARGRFWAGTASCDGRPTAGLYRLDAGGGVRRQVAQVRMSNGIGWSPDHTWMYHVDSAERGIDVFAFDVDDGTLGARRRLVDVAAGLGIPDGLTVDADGCVWLALWGSGRVHRYTPRGTLDRELRVPVTQVTSCTFGGPGLEVLYVTSARGGLDVDQRRAQPHAGAIFAVVPGVAGLPSHGYAG